jgi:prephenate dehydrogenase
VTAKADSSTESLVVVGVGLIGGSIGLAARRSNRFGTIIGVGRDSAGLEQARTLGCIDEFTTELAVAAKRADTIVFCTPVDRIAEQILASAPNCRPGTLITDAGSTKAEIVTRVESVMAPQVLFVGSHPLAGSEKKGAEHARADLFDDRLTLITPTAKTPKAACERAEAFWRGLGGRVKFLSPELHDERLAITSHLPHLVGAALTLALRPELAELAASGFRDTTRLAGGDPELWTAICDQNRSNILEAFGCMTDQLRKLKSALIERDYATLQQLLTEAKKVRDDLGS